MSIIGNPILLNTGNKQIKYSFGSYYGSGLGANTTSLTCSLSAIQGCFCVLIVMHRDTIEVPGFTFVHKTTGRPTYQWISIYTKTMTTASETVTISQASSVRLSACSIYFEKPVDIIYKESQEMDTNSSTYRYTISPVDYLLLAVINHGFAGTGSSFKTFSITPLTSILHNGDYVPRMCAFISHDILPSILSSNASAGSGDRLDNRLILYEIREV